MDNLSKEARHRNMSAIRSKNTKPEILVRKILFREGLRYRLHYKKIEGRPDITLMKYRTVINVNGCFWHQHKGCKRAVIPKSNLEYWIPKMKNNLDRDRKNKLLYRKMGWKEIIIWECETKDKAILEEIIKKRVLSHLNNSLYFAKR